MSHFRKLSYAQKPEQGNEAPLEELKVEDVMTVVESTAATGGMSNHMQTVELNSRIEKSYAQMLKRKVLLETFDWTSSDAPVPLDLTLSAYTSKQMQALKSWSIPGILYTNAFLADKFRNFTYFRGNVKLTTKVNATQFQRGMLASLTIPAYDQRSTYQTYATEYLASLTSNQMVTLNIEHEDTMELIIPFIWKRGYVRIGTSWANARLIVLSQLAGESDAERASVSVFAEIMDPEVQLPTDAMYIAQSERTSNPVRMEQTPEAQAINLDSVETVDLQPVNNTHTSSAEKCDDSFREILSRKAFVGRYVWTVDDLAGALIASIPVNPLASVTFKGNLSSFQYLCAMFKKWRGALDYELDIVKTKFHKGRLVLVFFPDQVSPPAFANSMLTTNFNTVLDLAPHDTTGAGDFSFSIPFVNANAVLNLLDTNGCVGIYVLNRLIVPEGMTASAEILMKVAGGSDFELFQPTRTYAPGLPAAGFVAQSERVPLEIVNGASAVSDIQPSLYGRMPKATSELARIMTPLLYSEGTPVTLNPTEIVRDDTTGRRVTSGGDTLVESFHSLMLQLYAYFHSEGVVRTFMSGVNWLYLSQVPGSKGVVVGDGDDLAVAAHTFARSSINNAVVDTKLPWYRNERLSFASQETDREVNCVNISPQTEARNVVYEAMGDECEYHTVVGPAYLVLNPTQVLDITTTVVPTIDYTDEAISTGVTQNLLPHTIVPSISYEPGSDVVSVTAGPGTYASNNTTTGAWDCFNDYTTPAISAFEMSVDGSFVVADIVKGHFSSDAPISYTSSEVVTGMLVPPDAQLAWISGGSSSSINCSISVDGVQRFNRDNTGFESVIFPVITGNALTIESTGSALTASMTFVKSASSVKFQQTKCSFH